MKLKNLIKLSSTVKSFSGWLKAQKDVEIDVSELTFIKFVKKYPIEALIDKNQHLFQRRLQIGRLKHISKKIQKFGFLMIPIIVDENYKMVDGQHRVIVAYLLGFKQVPVVVYNFKNQMEKAKFFSTMSIPEGGPIAVMDRVNAKKLAGDPYESMIYKLVVTDKLSLFRNKVSFKDQPNPNSKISLPSFMKITNWIGLGIRRGWETSYDGYLQGTVGKLGSAGYMDVRDKLNEFATWTFSWAGSTRASRSLLYRDKILCGFLDFYIFMGTCRGNKRKWNTVKKLSARKFMSYELQGLMDKDITAVPSSITAYYNKKRTTNIVKEIIFNSPVPKA